MAEEEYDYMSDNFLVEGNSQDNRPGLQNRKEKRQAELAKKKEMTASRSKQANRHIKALERENLRKGLEIPLDSSNKGFAMLQKMGFKPGTSLGKSGSGITEPIPVAINRKSREGLGVEAALKEMRKEKTHIRKKAKHKPLSVEDFRSRVSEELNEREAGIDLYKSQNSCVSLDSAQGINHTTEGSAGSCFEKNTNLQSLTEEGQTVGENVPEKRSRKKKKKVKKVPPPPKVKTNLEVVVVPEGYPKLCFDVDLFNELKNVIKAKIAEIKLESLTPQLNESYFYKDIEACIFKCSNRATASRLSRITSNIILRDFMRLRTTTLKEAKSMHKTKIPPLLKPESVIQKPPDDFCRIGLLLDGPLVERKNLVRRISTQNPELNLCKWVNIETIKKDRCFFFVASIPPNEMKILESLDYNIYFGLAKEKIFEVTDENSLRVLEYSKEISIPDYEYEEPYSLTIKVEEDELEETPENINKWFNALAEALQGQCVSQRFNSSSQYRKPLYH